MPTLTGGGPFNVIGGPTNRDLEPGLRPTVRLPKTFISLTTNPQPPKERPVPFIYDETIAQQYFNFLNAKWQKDRGAVVNGAVYLDVVGFARWYADWIVLQQQGLSPLEAARAVNETINDFPGGTHEVVPDPFFQGVG